MKAKLSTLIAAIVLGLSGATFTASAFAEEGKMVGPITKITMAADGKSATAILKAHNTPPEAITAFTTAADPKALMPSDDTPWAEVTGLCATHPDWQQTYYEFHLTLLDLKLPGAFQ